MVRRRLLCPALMLAAAACSATGEKGCTLVDMDSAVGARSNTPDVAVMRLCIDDDCQDAIGGQARVQVPDDPATYAYSVTVSRLGEDRTVTGRVTTKEYFVNGKDCGPRTANATLVVDGDGAIRTATP